MKSLNTWPPEYTVQISKRAKNIRLQMSLYEGLKIIVPYSHKLEDAIAFLNSKKKWVQKNWVTSIIKKEELPVEIKLASINQRFDIRYQAINTFKKPKLIEQRTELIIYGNINDFSACRLLLWQWLKKQGEKFLIPWLLQLSKQYQLPFTHVSLKRQISRWGSCTRSKKINLNISLLFLPATFVEYVLIHELCHTKQFNHSPKFWQLVQKYVPDYLRIRKFSKEGLKYVPAWFYFK